MKEGVKKFASPQTGSIYDVVAEYNDLMLSFREIDCDVFRVRIQANGPNAVETLRLVKSVMINGSRWSDVKGEDHISVVVRGERALCKALSDGVFGIMAINTTDPSAMSEY